MLHKYSINSACTILGCFAILALSACGGGSTNDSGPDDSSQNSTRDYKLVWTEDFGGESLDAARWNIETGYGPNNSGWGNDESQLYTDSSDNLKVEGGGLVITAICDSVSCGKRDGSITSAKINTKGKLELKYGKVEARINLPDGRSTWPAFWMLGASYPDVPWPQSGEIDIMEMHQQLSDIYTTHTTIHWFDETKPSGNEWTYFTQNKRFSSPLTSDFHVYTLEWDETKIIGKIDGMGVFEKNIDSPEMSEFHESFYLILNVAIDGNLGGVPDAIKTTPQKMIVDWVRVYEDSNAGDVAFNTTAPIQEPSPVQISVNEPPVVSSFDSGLLTNGDFENGSAWWSGNATNVTDELLGVDGSKANFASVDIAGNPWDVNLSQVVEIVQGETYKLIFKAKSDFARTIIAGIGLNEDPWTNDSETVNLTTDWQVFNLDLSALEFGSANSRVLFDLGVDTGQVIIDEVSLNEVENN